MSRICSESVNTALADVGADVRATRVLRPEAVEVDGPSPEHSTILPTGISVNTDASAGPDELRRPVRSLT